MSESNTIIAAPAAETKHELAQGARFTEKVLMELEAQGLKGLELSDYQRALVYNSFVAIDNMLKVTEENRIKKNARNYNHDFDNNLPYTWNNVNLQQLAIDCAHHAKLGLDMLQENFLFPIPYTNSKTNKYDIAFMKGYKGKEYVAYEFAVDRPLRVITELVYSTDTFKPLKASSTNQTDSYIFEINEPFNRGDITGAFGYIVYDNPLKNELHFLSRAQIEKRKPKKAAPEFWGGERDVYKNGKKAGKEIVEGWFDEMCLKTIKRYVYDKISADPKKVNASYKYVMERDKTYAMLEAQEEIEANANSIIIESDYKEVLDLDPPKEAEPPKADTPEADTPPETPTADEVEQDTPPDPPYL